MSQNIVMLHGWGYTPQVWGEVEGLFDTVSLSGVTTHCPTVRAPLHGSLEDWADALAPSLPQDSIVVGWSLGAMLALALATRHPDKVRAQVLIGATPCFVSSDDWPHGLAPEVVSSFCDAFAQSPQRTLEKFIALQVMGDAHRAACKAQLIRALDDAATHHVSLMAGLHLLSYSDLRSMTPAQPTLLLHGEHDALMPLAAAQHLERALPHAQLDVFPNTGHAPHVSNPYAVALAIKSLLDTLNK